MRALVLLSSWPPPACTALLALAATVFAAPAWAQQPEALGAEFRVNAFTTGDERLPAIATDAGGNFVVVWQESNDLVGRRFDSGGSALGSEFLVNSYRTSVQRSPAIASDANGNFVVVWESSGQDGSFYGAFGRRFDSAGNPLGLDFQINSYTTDFQRLPRIAMEANGNFVVVWDSSGQDGSGHGVFARRFAAGGSPLASEFRVSSQTTNDQQDPVVALDSSGNFVVVWRSFDQDGSFDGIFCRRFDSAGNAFGAEFQVNTYTTGNQYNPQVATAVGGGFVVVWGGSQFQDGSSDGVFGRRFDPGGNALGPELLINSYTTGNQIIPRIAADSDGNFVVVWISIGQDGSSDGVFGRRFDPAGSPLGSEFQINSFTPDLQTSPRIATGPGGNFVVVWESYGQDGSGSGVFGQRFAPAPDLIFADGLESADLTRWTAAVTDGTDLRATVAAAMAGTGFGLQALVNDTNSLYVQDDSPLLESRYRARFYLDPNGFDPGEASSHFRTRIFIAFDPSGLRVVTLVLKRQGGAYSVEGRVRRNDGTRADTGFFPISDGPHFIEFDWQRATGPGAGNGTLEMWIDDVFADFMSGIDNDQSFVDFARLGALALKSGAAGTLYFDEFESHRRTYVGP
jgi:hypothetical protein